MRLSYVYKSKTVNNTEMNFYWLLAGAVMTELLEN